MPPAGKGRSTAVGYAGSMTLPNQSYRFAQAVITGSHGFLLGMVLSKLLCPG